MKINTRYKLEIICILFALFACNTLKQKEISKTVILQSDSLDSVKKEVISEIKGQKTAVKTLDEIQNATNDWQAKLITYDTKQPIDKTSGKPPVLSQLEITNFSKSNQSAHTSELIKDDFSYRYQSEIDSLHRENSQIKEQFSQAEKLANNWWKWLLTGMIIPVLIFLIFRLIRFYQTRIQ